MNSNISANNIISTSSPGNNFFNGTITGTPRSPLTNQNWGVDFDYLVSNISPPNNSSSTNMYFSSSGDFYLPGVLVFSIEINPVLLPVQLVANTITCFNGKPDLTWITSSEVNNKEFELWSGKLPMELAKASSVSGKGTYSGTSVYNWKDENYMSGIKMYYRLSQVDFNGQKTELALHEVQCFKSRVEMEIYPVPFQNEINIVIPESENGVLCRLFRTDGALVNEQFIQNSSKHFVFRLKENITPDQYYVLEITGKDYPRYRIVKAGR
jgi:hypothetical protein